jgi:dihydroxyacetone kinase
LLQRRIAIPTTTPAKTTDKDQGVKTWAEFFKMIGMDALTATEAQKKENIDTRTEQIEQGIQAAKEQGLGDWTDKVAGRSFVRVGD